MKKISIKIDRVSFPHLFLNILRKHYDVTISDHPDYYFYQYQNNSFLNINKNAIKIFCAFQNTFPDMNFHDYAISIKNFSFKDRYFYYMAAFVNHHLERTPVRQIYTEEYAKRKFCNFIYSGHSNRPEAVTRENFCIKLSEYKRVDCPGELLNNMPRLLAPDGRKLASMKPDFLKKYKFTVAFENSFDYGYITEKIGDAFLSGSVPIYYGAQDVTEIFNPESFVDCRQFKSLEDAIDYVKYLDTHDEEYLKMLNAPIFNDDHFIEKFNASFEDFLVNIIEHGKIWANNWSQLYDVPWTIENQEFGYAKEYILDPLLKEEGISSKDFYHELDTANMKMPIPRDTIIEKFKKIGDNIGCLVRLQKYIRQWNELFPQSHSLASQVLDLINIITSIPGDKISFVNEEKNLCDPVKSSRLIFNNHHKEIKPISYKNFYDLIFPGGIQIKIDPVFKKLHIPDGMDKFIVFSIKPSVNAEALARDSALAAKYCKLIQYEPAAPSNCSSNDNITILNQNIFVALDYISSLAKEQKSKCALIFDATQPGLKLAQDILVNEPHLFNTILVCFQALSNQALLNSCYDFLNSLLAEHEITEIVFDCKPRLICHQDFLFAEKISLTLSRKDDSRTQPIFVRYLN